MEYSKSLRVNSTSIPGLLLFDLPVHGDNRGWFKENWQREKMLQSGLPDFRPVQNNISFNETIGTTRGIHAEPWDKFVSVASGKIFGAWVDLRDGSSFGSVFTSEIDPSQAVFVPRGVGNAFQTLLPDTAYSYLVNDHWSMAAQEQYTFLNLADDTVAIKWPIPLSEVEISNKDKNHPILSEVTPMPGKKVLVLGANGQLGNALRDAYAGATGVEFASRSEIDLGDLNGLSTKDWNNYSTIINAAAYTAVDAAESAQGRQDAWKTNVQAVSDLARISIAHNLLLVHISSDYVFDGSIAEHVEDEPPTPLGVYGQTKAAGDAVVSIVPRHYIVRTSWVIGEGSNFVRTMATLAARNVEPDVVDDQFGRLSFTEDIAKGIDHLITTEAPYGTYNLTNSGPVQSWADIAAEVYELSGISRAAVTGVSTERYFKDKASAPRPRLSSLNLDKIQAAGFTPPSSSDRLREYLAKGTS